MTENETEQEQEQQSEQVSSAFETCDFRLEDVAEMAQIFRNAIRITAADAHSPAQLAAWAKIVEDEEAFAGRLSEGWVRIAVDDEGIVGFAKIDMPGHIDMLYTAPRAARQGVATLLMDDMLTLGEAMGAAALTADASHVARALFVHFGFVETSPEIVEHHGENFIRHTMQRTMKRSRK